MKRTPMPRDQLIEVVNETVRLVSRAVDVRVAVNMAADEAVGVAVDRAVNVLLHSAVSRAVIKAVNETT